MTPDAKVDNKRNRNGSPDLVDDNTKPGIPYISSNILTNCCVLVTYTHITHTHIHLTHIYTYTKTILHTTQWPSELKHRELEFKIIYIW